jgi:hypothetical protein
VTRRVLVALGVALLIVSAFFAFLPVPSQKLVFGTATTTMYCGAGTSSDPAYVVWVDPGITLTGGPSGISRLPSAERRAEQLVNDAGEVQCANAAGSRLLTAMLFDIAGILCIAAGAWGVPYVVRRRERHARYPLAAFASGPPHGWYQDPWNSRSLRWWDGVRWTGWQQPGPPQNF